MAGARACTQALFTIDTTGVLESRVLKYADVASTNKQYKASFQQMGTVPNNLFELLQDLQIVVARMSALTIKCGVVIFQTQTRVPTSTNVSNTEVEATLFQPNNIHFTEGPHDGNVKTWTYRKKTLNNSEGLHCHGVLRVHGSGKHGFRHPNKMALTCTLCERRNLSGMPERTHVVVCVNSSNRAAKLTKSEREVCPATNLYAHIQSEVD